ncbi:MAG: ornithine carbamoyltransferase [Kiritimatiellaeota bacterium]|nr:ornithine carbamoyltransferase [Kiritimatiellota bacterium]
MKHDLGLLNRSLLTLADVTDAQMLGLLDLAGDLKAKKRRREPARYLDGCNIALLFEKASTRTRCAAVVAAVDLGAHPEYLGKSDIHLGKKETVADTARVLGRFFDGILFRGFAHATVEVLARFAGVPVWNGLTDDTHPTQTLADLLTVREVFGRLRGLKTVFLGDGRNNVCNSLMMGCAKAGMRFVNCCPPELAPRPSLVATAREAAHRNGGSVDVVHTPEAAVPGANILYTDVWSSMGEEDRFEERLELLRPYRVTMPLVRRTGNLEAEQVIFLHCLPAFHNDQTEYTRDRGALEVVDEVFEAPFSRVFDQAENRLHTLKSVMVATLAAPADVP